MSALDIRRGEVEEPVLGGLEVSWDVVEAVGDIKEAGFEPIFVGFRHDFPLGGPCPISE